MNKLAITAPLPIAVICSACSVTRRSGLSASSSLHSVTKTISRPETISVRLPLYSISRLSTDSVSNISCPVASSTARINTDGSITHTLQTNDTTLEAAVTATSVTVDSLLTTDRNSSTTTSTSTDWGFIALLVLTILIFSNK